MAYTRREQAAGGRHRNFQHNLWLPDKYHDQNREEIPDDPLLEDDLENYMFQQLRHEGADKPSVVSDEKKSDWARRERSKVFLNLMHHGARSKIVPQHSEEFLGETWNDPRGPHGVIPLKKVAEFMTHRQKNKVFLSDEDHGIREKTMTNLDWTKARHKVHNESRQRRFQFGTGVHSLHTQRPVYADNGPIIVSEASQPVRGYMEKEAQKHHRDGTSLLSNQQAPHWYTTTDHRVPVAKYTDNPKQKFRERNRLVLDEETHDSRPMVRRDDHGLILKQLAVTMDNHRDARHQIMNKDSVYLRKLLDAHVANKKRRFDGEISQPVGDATHSTPAHEKLAEQDHAKVLRISALKAPYSKHWVHGNKPKVLHIMEKSKGNKKTKYTESFQIDAETTQRASKSKTKTNVKIVKYTDHQGVRDSAHEQEVKAKSIETGHKRVNAEASEQHVGDQSTELGQWDANGLRRSGRARTDYKGNRDHTGDMGFSGLEVTASNRRG